MPPPAVQYSIKSLVSLARKRIRKVQDALEQAGTIIENGLGRVGSQPALARVPVRVGQRPQSAAQRLRSRLNAQQRCHYSTTAGYSGFQGSIFGNLVKYILKSSVKFSLKGPTGKFASKSPFTREFVRTAFNSGQYGNSFAGMRHGRRFPSSLYGNFNRHNARHFSNYSHMVTRDIVQNMTISTRAFFTNGSDKVIANKLTRGSTKGSIQQNFVPCAATASKNVDNVLGLIRDESRGLASCLVEFQISLPQFTTPAMNFLDEEYLSVFSNDVCEYQQEISIVNREIKAIFDHYGCLPIGIEKLDDKQVVVIRIHFANQDAQMVEQLLKDAQVSRGVVYETTEIFSNNDRRDSATSDEFVSCFASFKSDEAARPPSVPYSFDSDSISSDSLSSSEYEELFYPILSSSSSDANGLERSRGSFQVIRNAVIT
ncbi:hypothetical protein DASC09_064120 [Saccharomycopsis crataegensis]|uniref:Stationary phase protein 5 n=1 Tax=Saccharomycopsis crataegensis TaxID=43959 RepID=A0AAV5QYA4_9ASCO|nr:hypothetical protein DASC09_064120 [Saccharomycopsis crataegensis]